MSRDEQYREDILEAIEKIQNSTKELDYKSFLEDEDIYDACVRRLEIIGEAVKRLSEEFKANFAEVPWNEIAKFRDKAIHHYAVIDPNIVWETIQTDLPELQKALLKTK